jgi:Spy/CpxP family protein refolding chaperone
MIHLPHKLFATAAAIAVAGALSLAAPAVAADAATAAQVRNGSNLVEAQIARLHDQLHITDAQSAQFNAFAQVMRDNRNAHEALVKEKRRNEKTMTAVDDLNNYAEIAQAHAEGVKTLAAAFATLYASLSDDQKKTADEVFRQHKRRAMRHVMKKPQ